MSNHVAENKMGVQPINKLILTMGIPMVLSMIIQALYNIVDSFFVSQIPDVSDYAMNALTLVFPIQMLVIAIGVGTGIGVNSFLSLKLGQENRKEASHATGNAIFLGICTYIVFLIFGIWGTSAYLNTQTSNEVVLSMGKEYLTICMTLSFGVVLSMIYEKLLQSTGKTMHATIAQIAGALTNIVLDPILIFALLGAPTCGLNNALIPLAAYNYGKGDKKRVHDTICFGVLDTVIIMLICMVVLEVFAGNIASVFALSPEILSLCKTAMSVIAAGYLFAGVNIAFQGIFQAMGRGSYSLVISLIRMVIICLPLAWIAVQYVPNKELVFAAFPIAELCGAVVSYLMYKNVKKLSL